MNKLTVTVVDPVDSLLPVRATPGSSGYDLRAAFDGFIHAGARALISTGVRIEFPTEPVRLVHWERIGEARVATTMLARVEGQVRPRSGLTRKGIDVPLGTIDSDYRGEVGVCIVNNGSRGWYYKKGDRIAQLVFALVLTPALDPVTPEEWNARVAPTARGEGGFGSTGER